MTPGIIRCRGFTLIEVLVVISIIAMLVALLLPALSKAKQVAYQVQCLSQMRQQGIGWASYTIEYRQIPGLSGNEGTYGGKPWGQPYLYGGVTLWVHDGAYANNYEGPMNMGYIAPYVTAGSLTDGSMNRMDGRIFYCPGTTQSYGSDGTSGWYATWKTNMSQMGLAAGASTVATYFYRSGQYDIDRNLSDGDANWAWGGANMNWMTNTPSRPDDRWVQGKPMLTCFWRGYNGSAINPRQDNIVHGGRSTNLLRTDGSAYSWGLPDDVNPVWGWFDAGAYTPAQYDGDNFYNQMPWFWVRADRKR